MYTLFSATLLNFLVQHYLLTTTLQQLLNHSIKIQTQPRGYVTAQKIKFSVNDFFSKCEQVRSFLRICSHLLKKSLTEHFIFLCSVFRKKLSQISFKNSSKSGFFSTLQTSKNTIRGLYNWFFSVNFVKFLRTAVQ